jgi:hypothetical protein
MTVARELAEFKLDVMGIQEVRWDKEDQRMIIHFSMETGMVIMI